MPQSEISGVSRRLADLVAATSWADVAAQQHEAKRSILNFFATALGSAREVLACVQVAQAMRYIGTVDARALDRMDHVIATLGRLAYRRAS